MTTEMTEDQRVAMSKLMSPADYSQTPTNAKVATWVRKRILNVQKKAKRFGCQTIEVVNAARGLTCRAFPHNEGPVSRVLRRMTRKERIAINAVAGVRPMERNEYGFMQPKHLVR